MPMLLNESPRSARSLAWSATVSALAIEKLRDGHGIAQEEREALLDTAREFGSLSQVGRIEAGSLVRGETERLTSALRESLSTLVALEKSSSYTLNFNLLE